MSLTTIDFRRLHLRGGERLLDLGCGEGRHAISAWLEAPIEAVGLDPCERDLHIAAGRAAEFSPPGDASSDDVPSGDGPSDGDLPAGGRPAGCRPAGCRRLHWVRGSGLRLPFPDASFDRVICAEVLEHIPDHQAMLAEIRRVLKPGGLLAVSVPRFVPEWICWRLSTAYHQVEGGHIRIFRGRQLRRAVEAQGMRRLRRHWAHGLHTPYWWLRCLFWSRGPEFAPVRQYHRLLVWDLMQRPRLTRLLDRLLNPLIGKSLVMYFIRDLDDDAGRNPRRPDAA